MPNIIICLKGLLTVSVYVFQHMQEFCHFDLTTPIRGTEPKVIRKLIMGETLKVRGRKDSKVSNVMKFARCKNCDTKE